jgi:GTP-binding protein HflX
MVDTVGFIRRLPHALIDAFRSTLEEVTLAAVLIHVLDASDPDAERFHATTLSVLAELGAEQIPVITVLNKIDRLDCSESPSKGSPEYLEGLLRLYPDSIALSVKTGAGLDILKARLEDMLAGQTLRFRFPAGRGDLPALLHRSGQVISEKYEDGYIEVEANTDEKTAGQLKEYIIPGGHNEL